MTERTRDEWHAEMEKRGFDKVTYGAACKVADSLVSAYRREQARSKQRLEQIKSLWEAQMDVVGLVHPSLFVEEHEITEYEAAVDREPTGPALPWLKEAK